MTTGNDNKAALSLDKVLASIPADINEQSPTKDPLGDLLARISSRKVPVNSLVRMWALGSMQAKITVGYLAYALRSSFSSTSKQQELLNETHLKAAIQLLGTMGYLRGAVMKVGQLLANLPHVVPEQIADTLERLQFEAPPMHYALIREVFLDEFGKEPEELFASFDKQAFAAASLGQVHRAILKSGEEVAVKIQYPNMAATIRNDLASLRKIVLPMKLKAEGRYLFDHLDEIESMLTAETDYRGEALRMRQARDLFTAADQIVVPKVWEAFSTDRVLTSDLLKGRHPGDFLKSNPDQAARDHFGTLITRANFRIYNAARALYADPHPGNFLFLDDNRLGLIDFGCIRTLSDEEWQLQVEADEAICHGSSEAMDAAIAKACFFASATEMEPDRLALLTRMTAWQAAPLGQTEPFDFGDRDFYQQGIDLYTEATRKGYLRNSSLYIWWTRLIFGHRSLLYRLRSRVALAKIYTEEKTH